MHHIMNLLLENKLHLAPIVENPQKILDIGTGTGIWAIDVAESVKRRAPTSSMMRDTYTPATGATRLQRS